MNKMQVAFFCPPLSAQLKKIQGNIIAGCNFDPDKNETLRTAQSAVTFNPNVPNALTRNCEGMHIFQIALIMYISAIVHVLFCAKLLVQSKNMIRVKSYAESFKMENNK